MAKLLKKPQINFQSITRDDFSGIFDLINDLGCGTHDRKIWQHYPIVKGQTAD